MKLQYSKYHALRNDFLIIESKKYLKPAELSRIAEHICDRRSGVGADGILYLSKSRKATRKFTIYNSDGSWAEKSGNGLRIAGLHMHRLNKKKKNTFETTTGINRVILEKRTEHGWMLQTELGKPVFETDKIPVKTKVPFMINAPLKIDKHEFPVTCVSVGNPHTVLIVENFEFDWQTLGEDIEYHPMFPNRTNVEFVKPVNRKKIKLADWERGAGATGSSGTAAAASVATCVTLGLVDRQCEVVFESGSLFVNWRDDEIIELTGEVSLVADGMYYL